MPGIERTDFSGGMVTDVSELKMPENAVRNAQNVDLWSERGAIQLLKDIAEKTEFPSGKVYDHHVFFPAHGDKDYVIAMMSDGTIYSYDGTSFTSIGSVTVGAKMAYSGDSVYVFYRNMTSPTLANTIRKTIEYDYDAGTFSLVDVTIDNGGITIGDREQVTLHSQWQDSDNTDFKGSVVNLYGDGAESNGVSFTDSLSKGAGNIYLLDKSAASFDKLRVYLSLYDPFDTPLTKQLIQDGIEDSGKIYIGFTQGWSQEVLFTGGSNNDRIIVTETAATAAGPGNEQACESPLQWVLKEYIAGTKYVKTDADGDAHKIRYNGEKWDIQSITFDTGFTSNNINVYIITLDRDFPLTDSFALASTADTGYIWGGNLLEVELIWVSDKLPIPVEKTMSSFLGVQIDESRPESKYTNGTGNVLAKMGNRLVTANPYFPDTYSEGEDEDKKGFLCWSWITGEGKFANSLMPNTQLIAPTLSGSAIIDLVSWAETVLLLQKNGMARFKFDNSLQFLQNDKWGVENDLQYHVDQNNLFLFSNRKLVSGAVDKLNYETGAFKLIELSRVIASQLDVDDVDARLFYDNLNELIFLQDVNENINDFICSLRNGEPVWVKYSNGTRRIVSGFKLNGEVLFFVKDGASDYGVYKYHATNYVTSIEVEDRNIYIPMGHDFMQKLEVLYVKPSGTLTFTPILDDTELSGVALPNKSNAGFYEIKLARSGKTRFDKFRWKLEGSSLTSAFKFLGVFINRDQYTRETQGGY